MQVSMMMLELKPETVNIWDFESSRKPGTRIQGIDLKDDRGGEACLHFASKADIVKFAQEILDQCGIPVLYGPLPDEEPSDELLEVLTTPAAILGGVEQADRVH